MGPLIRVIVVHINQVVDGLEEPHVWKLIGIVNILLQVMQNLFVPLWLIWREILVLLIQLLHAKQYRALWKLLFFPTTIAFNLNQVVDGQVDQLVLKPKMIVHIKSIHKTFHPSIKNSFVLIWLVLMGDNAQLE